MPSDIISWPQAVKWEKLCDHPSPTSLLHLVKAFAFNFEKL